MYIKELSLCHKLRFSYPFIFPTECPSRPLIFKTMNSIRSDNLSMKYQRFAQQGCKDIEITKI